jgi:hypothetical protein
MKTTLYALMVADAREASSILRDAVDLVNKGIVEDTEQVLTSDGAIVLSRELSRCLVSTLKGHLQYGASVLLSSFGVSPPDVGFCWQILLGLHIEWPRDVWLSTFVRSDLERNGTKVQPLRIDGRDGYVVSSQRFSELFP